MILLLNQYFSILLIFWLASIYYFYNSLPKVRKQLADAFYLCLMTLDNEEIISMEKNQEL